jgi:hypothetical protein
VRYYCTWRQGWLGHSTLTECSTRFRQIHIRTIQLVASRGRQEKCRWRCKWKH